MIDAGDSLLFIGIGIGSAQNCILLQRTYNPSFITPLLSIKKKFLLIFFLLCLYTNMKHHVELIIRFEWSENKKKSAFAIWIWSFWQLYKFRILLTAAQLLYRNYEWATLSKLNPINFILFYDHFQKKRKSY